jgi:hypothetical protein
VYGKLFASMYDGTLYGNWQALVTFQQMIILADRTGIVDMTPQAIAARTSIPFEIIKAGIEALEAPDPYSRSPEHEGRRIVRLDEFRPWGWQIVNYVHYCRLFSADDKREKDRQRIAEKRKQIKSVAERRDLSRPVADVAHIDVDVDVDVMTLPSGESGAQKSSKTKKPASRLPEDFPLTEERRAVAQAEGLDAARVFPAFRDHWIAASGQSARKHDWDAAWRNWCRREATYSKAKPERVRGGLTESGKRWGEEEPEVACAAG